jgi:hypothetical protein
MGAGGLHTIAATKSQKPPSTKKTPVAKLCATVRHEAEEVVVYQCHKNIYKET